MNVTMQQQKPFAAPSWLLAGLEPLRAALEYTSMRMMRTDHLPTGDGHPIIIFPGLASDHQAIGPLKEFCNGLGYSAHDWGRGFNSGPKGDPEVWLDALAADVLRLTENSASTVSLVGWSLGGIYAREVAKRLGSKIRQVITIGSPFAGTSHQTHAGLVYRILNGQAPPADQATHRKLRSAPGVPTSSIFSRSDGVVAWQACVQPGARANTENIEVSGSHCGLGWNPEVFAVLADRLSQPEGRWKRYGRPSTRNESMLPARASSKGVYSASACSR